MAFVKKPVKGMNDFLPADMCLREQLISRIKHTYTGYGFMQIETPVMEHIENLTSKQGGDNEKLIFQVLKRGRELDRALAAGAGELADSGLRYDLTVPLARYFANNKEQLPMPFKALQIGNVWRADNPQKGRFRQFTQCDIDILGDATSLAEIELIEATSHALVSILEGTDITGLTVHVNDRAILRGAALAAGFAEDDVPGVLITLDKMDKIGFEGVEAELVGNGFDAAMVAAYLGRYRAFEGGSCAEFCADIPGECLDDDIAQGLQEILDAAGALVPAGITLAFDPTLVRGMGYYTGPIFEVTVDGYGFSIAGGGRYDHMIGKFSGEEVCACGFSIGFERIVTILRDFQSGGAGVDTGSLVYLIDKKVPADKRLRVLREAAAKRAEGVIVDVEPMKKNVGRQIAALEDQGFTEFVKVYAD